MENQRIIYNEDNGRVAIIIPATESGRTIEEIAKKDVPTGYKYKIVEDTDVPTDRSFRDAWTVDESDLTDGVGS